MGRLRYIKDNRFGEAGSTATGVMIYSPFGKLIGGSVGQTLGETGTTQYYDLGTRMVTGDGRVYRYAKAGGTLVPGMGVANEDEQHITYAVLPAAVAAGAKSLSITVGAHDGTRALHDGTLAANELTGGYLMIMDNASTNQSLIRMIVTNTAVASGGGTTTITIDDPIPTALTTSDAAEAMASPYRNVQTLSGGVVDTCAKVGVPTMPATVGQYVWIQTWGVCWCAPHSDVGTGDNVHECYFNGDGSLGLHGDGASLQHAGFVLARARGGGQGAPFIMLQISI